jgi:hypothetical protein
MADQASLKNLIRRGEELRQEPYNSPVVDMWQNDVKAEVAKYGEATVEILQNTMHFSRVITSDYDATQQHNAMIDRVQKLLEDLQKRNPADTQAQSQLINQKREEAKTTLGAKFGPMTINGPATFGDHSPANNLQVSELMVAIISEAEQTLPDGSEKNRIIDGLKAIVANPTFAAMSGASLPQILKHLLG